MSTSILAYGQRVARGPLEAIELPDPGPPGGFEVEIGVDNCSVCHSDVHLLDGDWGEPRRPLVPGHEIVGRVLRRGPDATLAEGTLVGVGWQAGACGACGACRSDRSHLCTGGKVRTCVGRQGGFATRVRVDSRFAFELPATLDAATAGPLLCAGLTVFSPLERFAVGAGKRVGVVGAGGLGHLAVRFASAMGAEVIAFDPDLSKRDLALSLGARDLIDATGPLPAGEVDLLLVTTHAPLLWDEWMKVLDLEGTLCLIGVPPSPLKVGLDPLQDEQKSLTGSVIGSPATMRRMLDFSALHGVRPITERMPMSRANEAIARVREGRARMRVILDVGTASSAG